MRRPVVDVTVLVAFLGVALLHSRVVGGVNASLADLVVVVLVMVVSVRRLVVSPAVVLSFLAIMLFNVATTLFFTPLVFGIDLTPVFVAQDLLKLAMSFLYFIVGHEIVRSGALPVLLRWFASAGLGLSALGAITALGFGGAALHGLLYVGDIRYRGLVNDPNLCAVLLVAALPWFTAQRSWLRMARVGAGAVILAGVLATGSKTGLATYSLYIAFLGMRTVVAAWRGGTQGRVVMVPATVLALALLLAPSAGRWLSQAGSLSPAASRSLSALLDPAAAMQEAGSGREDTFLTALAIIREAPATGVGVGTYTAVGERIAGTPVLAHNTYLQLASQWGIPLALLFLTLVAVLMWARLPSDPAGNLGWRAARDMCGILLLGGLGVSLNNVRLFWVLLGVLFFGVSAARRAGQDRRQETVTATSHPLRPSRLPQ